MALLLTFVMEGRASGATMALDEESMETQVMNTDLQGTIWTVLFHGKSASKLVKDYEEHATKMKGLVKSGVVDVTKGKKSMALMQLFGLEKKDLPQVFLLPSVLLVSPQDWAPVQYKGVKTPTAISAWAAKHLPSRLITVCATDGQVDQFLHADPGLPKALLFTEKSNTSSLYKSLSLRFGFQMAFAEVRISPDSFVSEKYDVTSYPTLLVFRSSAEHAAPEKYAGKNDIESIASWITPLALPLDERTPAKQRYEESLKTQELSKKRALVNPTIRITTEEQWMEQVLSKHSVSLVAFLDPTDSSHKEYLRMLKTVHAKTKKGGTQYYFAWLDATQQQGVANMLGVAGETPRLVYLHAWKGWYKPFVGAFTKDKIWTSISSSALLTTPGKPIAQYDLLKAFAPEQNEDLFELDPAEEPDAAPKKDNPEPKKVTSKPQKVPPKKTTPKETATKDAKDKAKQEKPTETPKPKAKGAETPEASPEPPEGKANPAQSTDTLTDEERQKILKEFEQSRKEERKKQKEMDELLRKLKFQPKVPERPRASSPREALRAEKIRKKKEQEEKERELDKAYQEQDGELIMMQDVSDELP